MNEDLRGKTVVVTGAARGIGAACVRWLQDRGATVVGVDLDPSDADESVQLDLSDTAGYGAVVDAAGEAGLYGLVNNAAASSTTDPATLTPTEFDRLVAVNLRAPYFLSERLLDALQRGAGSVVHVASVHALATSPGAVAYAATKGGVAALTRAQAVDWAARGLDVRVNAIAPGAVDTPMLRDGLARTGLASDELSARHPLGRLGHDHEIAATVGYLLSPAAGFVHGAVLVADGGALAQLSTERPTGGR